MKKRFLLNTQGVAAGLLYILDANWRKQNGKERAPKRKSTDSELSAKRPGQTASLWEESKSTGATSQAASMARVENGKAVLVEEKAEPAIDDKGKDLIEALQILRNRFQCPVIEFGSSKSYGTCCQTQSDLLLAAAV
jgi:hypothetical protein